MPEPKFRRCDKRGTVRVSPRCVRFKDVSDDKNKLGLTFGSGFKDEFQTYKYVSIYTHVEDDNVYFWFCHEKALPLAYRGGGSLKTLESIKVTEMLNKFFPCKNFYRDIKLLRAKVQPISGSLYYAPKDVK